MPKAKIILSKLTPQSVREFEGKIVARESGLVRIKRVYAATESMEYYFLGNEKEVIYGKLNIGFYAVVAWCFDDEDQLCYNVMQSQVEEAVYKFVRRDKFGRYITTVPEKYFVPSIHIFLNEHGEVSLKRF